MGRDIRTLGLDGGKVNSWWTVWEGKKFKGAAQLPTPPELNDYFQKPFHRAVRRMLDKAGIEEGDEVVVERFQYRPGRGANTIEYVNLINGIVGTWALRRGARVYTRQASVHKQAYNTHHPEKFPRALIEKVGLHFGEWRPRAKRTDPCQHVMDSMTLACHHLLKREGLL